MDHIVENLCSQRYARKGRIDKTNRQIFYETDNFPWREWNFEIALKSRVLSIIADQNYLSSCSSDIN